MPENNTNMLYRLLTGPDNSEFCHKITKALNEGWVLYGNPSITFDEGKGVTVCAQAVTKQTTQPYDPQRKLGDY